MTDAGDDPGARRRRVLLTWSLTAIALVFVAVTGFRGVVFPDPTCEGLAEAAGQVVPLEAVPTATDVPLVSPDDVAVAACLRQPPDGDAPLVQVLLCSASVDDLDVPLATSELVGELRLVDADGGVARTLTTSSDVTTGSFVVDLPARTCLLTEQVVAPTPDEATSDLRVEARLGIAYAVQDAGDEAPPQAVTTPETLADLDAAS